ncbi:Protein kinase, putative [Hondaea fermentalgiana]|uniref:Protein kinase, putative n=1 Tax=Hondaea fermentalgiana TaxID=2315210 RepID=A0A2R5GNQ0_9STRA|nr:Protein kinase, putative [Hondaea fermentalgiana]|eukprot:GBG32510.1 Protein kinase, putative [Hondaea fermentalgiana]
MRALQWCFAFCCEAEDDGETSLEVAKHLRTASGGPEEYASFGETHNAGLQQQQKMPLRILARVPEVFASRYEVHEIIGHGSSSKCYHCTRRSDGRDFAVKVIDFGSLSLQYPKRALKRLYREVQSLQLLDHDNIVHMEEFYACGDSLLIVEEYLRGGELYDHILENQGLEENEARFIFYQIASAIDHMHARNIMHRDIKPENILLTHQLSNHVKLIDFGFSKTMKGSHASSFLGTGGFLAPELRLKEEATAHESNPLYTKSVDIWALGCLLYVMIAARMPFDDTLYHRPRSEFKLRFLPERKWRHISRECKSLLVQMLQPEPLRRSTSRDVIQHAWLRDVRTAARKSFFGHGDRSIPNSSQDGPRDYWRAEPSTAKTFSTRHEEYSEDGSCSTRTRSTSPADARELAHSYDAESGEEDALNCA